MGNYNPHAPGIVGNEWVPIRQADYTPDDKITERGYAFTLQHTTAVVSGAYYTNEANGAFYNAEIISVYPAGKEDETGPIRTLTIPSNGISVTGTIFGGATVPSTQDRQNGFTFQGGQNASVGVSFNTTAYAQALAGKRILDVSLVYVAFGTVLSLSRGTIQLGKLANPGGAAFYAPEIDGFTDTTLYTQAATLSLGEVNPYWQPGNTTVYSPIPAKTYPWRYDELAWLDTPAIADRMVVIFQCDLTQFASEQLSVEYAALQITYCEEQRVLYGGDLVFFSGSSNRNMYFTGGKLVMLRTPAFGLPTTLAPGDYTVVHSSSHWGRNDTIISPPSVKAVRELYQLPNQRGTIVNRTLTPDKTFTVSDTDVLEEVTLHTAGGIVTGVHAYGSRIGIPVYGAVTAIQEIEDDAAGSSKSYPQVRFYARRFGDTTVPLRLIDVATGTSSVSISVADFDALPEIVDGWREVTLRFSTPPVFAAAAGDIDWRWDAVGELAGNQWQVLGADGPSISGTQTTSPATYYAPNNPTPIVLTWQSPTITGTADDTLSDATLIFSTDPPIVSGFALVTATQTVTGALHCGSLPGSIVTGIGYNRLTWTSVAVTGSLEIQRSDVVDAAWQTILLTASTAITGFSDYEARVGVAASYRIRALNELDFPGSWSTVSGTLAAPGVTPGDGNSVLIFTSNFGPTGNLAYVMEFDGTPVEDFTFPEADDVVFQKMYLKNFPTAFHPLERGGEQFTRTLLVNAAAIPVPSLANFRGLRDLGWASLPYVCVRDELGNRWFANVLVPSGTVRSNREVYLAQVKVTEVTDTPCAVM